MSNRDSLKKFCDGTPMPPQELENLRNANLIANDGESWYVTTAGSLLLGHTPPRFVAEDASHWPDEDLNYRARAVLDTVANINVKVKVPNALDVQIAGDHYKNLAIQPAEFIEKNAIPFLEGCIIKRMCRHGNKAGAEDLRKAKHEIDLILQLRYGVGE